jgi:hypothetical protein
MCHHGWWTFWQSYTLVGSHRKGAFGPSLNSDRSARQAPCLPPQYQPYAWEWAHAPHGVRSSARLAMYNYGTTQVSYTIRLTVTDNTGATSTASLTEYVNPDYAPVAHLTLSTNASDTSGVSIYADASASTDADVDGYSPPYYF